MLYRTHDNSLLQMIHIFVTTAITNRCTTRGYSLEKAFEVMYTLVGFFCVSTVNRTKIPNFRRHNSFFLCFPNVVFNYLIIVQDIQENKCESIFFHIQYFFLSDIRTSFGKLLPVLADFVGHSPRSDAYFVDCIKKWVYGNLRSLSCLLC